MDIDICINPVNKIAKPWSLSKDDRLLFLVKEHTPLNKRILISINFVDWVEADVLSFCALSYQKHYYLFMWSLLKLADSTFNFLFAISLKWCYKQKPAMIFVNIYSLWQIIFSTHAKQSYYFNSGVCLSWAEKQINSFVVPQCETIFCHLLKFW